MGSALSTGNRPVAQNLKYMVCHNSECFAISKDLETMANISREIFPYTWETQLEQVPKEKNLSSDHRKHYNTQLKNTIYQVARSGIIHMFSLAILEFL